MYGKMTTSRIGIIGRRFVSDFSFEVSIVLLRARLQTLVAVAAALEEVSANRPFPIL
jgi:hypothetical protein